VWADYLETLVLQGLARTTAGPGGAGGGLSSVACGGGGGGARSAQATPRAAFEAKALRLCRLVLAEGLDKLDGGHAEELLRRAIGRAIAEHLELREALPRGYSLAMGAAQRPRGGGERTATADRTGHHSRLANA
jgi:hypothetical protein